MSKSREKPISPVISAWVLFVILVVYILFNVWERTCKTICNISDNFSSSEIALIVMKKTVQTIASDGGRNLGLLLAASIGWYFLARRTHAAEREARNSEQNIKISEQNIKITEQNIQITEQKMISERIARSIKQLVSENPFIRLTAISDLEKVAEECEKEREKIRNILSARIREIAPRDLKKENQISLSALANKNTQALFENYWVPFVTRQKQHEDIENLLKALSSIRRLYPDGNFICNLHGTDLSGLSLFGFRLPNFSFSNTNLIGVNFNLANLTGAYISLSNLTGANFNLANLTDVCFNWSNFKDTRLSEANISNADFRSVKDLTPEQIQEAFYWEGKPPRNLPDDWKLPPAREKHKEGGLTDILPPPPLSSS